MLFLGKMIICVQKTDSKAVMIVIAAVRSAHCKRQGETTQKMERFISIAGKCEPESAGKRFAGCIFLRPVV